MPETTIRCAVKESEARATAALSLEIEAIALDLFAASNTPPGVIDECVLFALEFFKYLTIQELRPAFRLALAGKLGDLDLQTYYGNFTPALFARVLNAYNDTFRGNLVLKCAPFLRDSVPMLPFDADSQTRFWETNRLARLCEIGFSGNVFAADARLLIRSGLVKVYNEDYVDLYIQAVQVEVIEIHALMRLRRARAVGSDERLAGLGASNVDDDIRLRQLRDLDLDSDMMNRLGTNVGVLITKRWLADRKFTLLDQQTQ